jgi:hypothetical protein
VPVGRRASVKRSPHVRRVASIGPLSGRLSTRRCAQLAGLADAPDPNDAGTQDCGTAGGGSGPNNCREFRAVLRARRTCAARASVRDGETRWRANTEPRIPHTPRRLENQVTDVLLSGWVDDRTRYSALRLVDLQRRADWTTDDCRSSLPRRSMQVKTAGAAQRIAKSLSSPRCAHMNRRRAVSRCWNSLLFRPAALVHRKRRFNGVGVWA